MEADEREFTAFVSARYAALVALASVLTGDTGHGEDLVQLALVRTFAAWRRLDAPEAYTRKVLVRLAGKRRRSTHTELIDAQVADHAPTSDAARDIAIALAALPFGQRAVLVLRYFDGRSEREIADLLGCSVGTVKSRANRALVALRSAGALSDSEVRHG